MFKKSILALGVMLLISSTAMAKSISVQEIQDLPAKSPVAAKSSSKLIDQNNWVYKTLEDVTKRYGVLVGKPEDKFNGTKPLTRNEAALVLINLFGKIQQDKVVLTDGDKAKLDILKQELREEVNELTGRVANLETTVDSLKGSVSKLEEADQKSWKFDYGEKFKITGGLQAQFTGGVKRGADAYPSNFSLPYSEITFQGTIRPHVKYLAQTVPTRFYDGSEKGLLREAYASTDIIPHHTLYVGQTMVPLGYEGPMSPLAIETIDFSQISRNLTTKTDLGIKAEGDWKYLSYAGGAYNGNGQNRTETSGDLAYVAKVALKPLAAVPQFGDLQLGSSFYSGSNGQFGRDITTLFGAYKYKKFALWSEAAYATGYQNPHQKAKGFYVHSSYYLTKKLQVLARYDQFDPNNVNNLKNLNREYTLGANYLLNDNLSFMMSLVDVQNQAGKDSNRIEALSQFLF